MAGDKDLSKLKQNPKGVRFSELQKVILRAGFRLVNIKGAIIPTDLASVIDRSIRSRSKLSDCVYHFAAKWKI